MCCGVGICKCVQEPKEARNIRTPGYGITGSCEPADLAARNQTWVFCKGSEFLEHWVISPDPRNMFFCRSEGFQTVYICGFRWPGTHCVSQAGLDIHRSLPATASQVLGLNVYATMASKKFIYVYTHTHTHMCSRAHTHKHTHTLYSFQLLVCPI